MRRQWETEELIDQWTLHAEDRTLLSNKTGATRLGFAALLKYFQRTGRFPQYKNDIPGLVITYLQPRLRSRHPLTCNTIGKGAPLSITAHRSVRHLGFARPVWLMQR